MPILERRYTESIEALEAALRLEPDNPGVFLNLASAYHLNGNHEEALALVRKFAHGGPELEAVLDKGYAEGGYRGALRSFAETLAVQPMAAEMQSKIITNLFAWAGEKERTLEWLELMFETRNPNLIPTISSPETDLVRDDPRFHDLRRRVGLPAGREGN